MDINMNKRGVQIKNMFFAVVVASMVIIAVGNIMGQWGEQYGSGISYDLDEYDNLDRFAQESETQKGKITPQDSDPGTGDFEGKIFSGGYGILGRVFSPFGAVWNMFESIEERLGIADQAYVRKGVLTLMFFAIVASLIAIIFRLPRSSA